jgi:2-oxoisovalerate dehydrogenase E1 component
MTSGFISLAKPKPQTVSRKPRTEEPKTKNPKALAGALLLPRVIEEKMLSLIRQGRISKWFSGYGQEAIAVGCAWALRDSDYALPMHRNLGLWTTRGVPLERLFCQLMGKESGFTRGRDRTFHFGLPERRIVGMISHMGAMLPVACGLGLSAKLRGDDFVALALTGEGGTREGDFHEALSLASVWNLPVIFVVENNGYALSTPAGEELPVEDVADAAAGYGMPGQVVDGNDVLAVIDAASSAAIRARNGNGPTLLEMKTFRMRGHEEASGTKYVPDELFDEWGEKDPIDRFKRDVIEQNVMSENEWQQLRADLADEIDDVAEWALDQPEVGSTPEAERADLFAPAFSEHEPPGDAASEKRFIDAVSDGLRQKMEHDESVVVMGQDIAEYGGVFKVTEGFAEEFGTERVRNTPIIESGAIGAALGLAIEGFRPVVELQYADFISCGFNQTVNNLATTRYRWGAEHDATVGVTLRMPYGGGLGAGPFHSQSMEAMFCHVPGLKVVAPATPADAKGLILAALADPNPVLFFEQKKLYRSVEGDVPEAAYRLPLGTARVAREGGDATVVTYGAGVHWALDEAERVAEERGAELEVIDLRTLAPWDRGAVLASLKKTSRLLVLHEAPRTGGFGAELAAEVAEEGFTLLDAPPARVGAEDLPVPFSKNLEGEIYSAHSKLRGALDRLLAF